jgi:hypothetical protein
MGLFFEQRDPDQRLVTAFRDAIVTSPAADLQEQAMNLAGEFDPFIESLSEALTSPKPATVAAVNAMASTKATELTDGLLGGPTFNTGRFLVALLIFFALLGGAIGTDVAELKTSPTALYALATTVFGIVVGFLGSEKS